MFKFLFGKIGQSHLAQNSGCSIEALKKELQLTSPEKLSETISKKLESDGQSITTTTTTTVTTSKDGKVVETTSTTVSHEGQPDETHASQVIKEAPIETKEIKSFKTEFVSCTPADDDYDSTDVYSPRSDISSGQESRAAAQWDEQESHQYSDDETASPFSARSKQKFSYDDPYEHQRSGSIGKRSDIDFDDSQDDIPPQYGSHDVETARSVGSSYRPDPMSTSFYGELPSAFSQAEPVTVSTVRTVITRQQYDYPSSGPESGTTFTSAESTTATRTGDHKFLDDADLDFDKALEQHIQARGPEVMSSVTSKYAFSPTKNPFEAAEVSTQQFPLEDVKPVAKSSADQAKDKDITSTNPGTVSTSTVTVTSTASSGHGSSSTTITTTTATTSSTPGLTLEEIEANLRKAEERVASWGKPLGLPSPAPPSDSPKRDRKIINKIKQNNERNLRKRSDSPSKGKKVSPVYVDLTYVPHHGNSYYSHLEFFKRVRARYYVFSGTEPSREVYNALLEAKQTWEDKDLGNEPGIALALGEQLIKSLCFHISEVTIIPTYDTDVLGYWVSENEELLTKYHIDLSPSASRCTINLQDHETSCSAYRLEF